MSFLTIERVAIHWTRYLALFAGWLLLAVAIVTASDALIRDFLGRPLPGTFEATELVLAAIIFFGLPLYESYRWSRVGDFLTGRLGQRTQHAIIAVNALICAGLFGVITLQMAMGLRSSSPRSAPPLRCASRSFRVSSPLPSRQVWPHWHLSSRRLARRGAPGEQVCLPYQRLTGSLIDERIADCSSGLRRALNVDTGPVADCGGDGDRRRGRHGVGGRVACRAGDAEARPI